MNRHTGRTLSGWPHIRQSLGVIFTTRIGTRVMRREFGSAVPDLQDKPSNVEQLLDHMVAVATAIDAHEPRVELEGFRIEAIDEGGRAQIHVDVRELATGLSREMPT
ncbi:MAG: GPW/gp25 family protein [Paracoccaceae bacterium]